jgi:hypothetical protein
MDQGDPDVTTLLGDTPGTLGWNDYADSSLPTLDSSQNICRLDDGTPVSLGKDVPKAVSVAATDAAGTIPLAQAQELALGITTYFEGGKSLDYQALADDFDNQGTSFGLIQWNFGQNTLGPLLTLMMNADPTAFAGCFGADADYETLKTALTAGKKDDQVKWARAVIKGHRSAWSAAFKNIGANVTFNRIQREQAIAKYHSLATEVIKTLRGTSPTLFEKIEFRTYAAIFDLCVQQGGIDGSIDEIKKRVSDEKPSSQLDVMKIVVTERGKKAKKAWVSDCISRRMGILTGAKFKSEEHNVTAARYNSQFNVIGQSGEKIVSDL